MDWTIDALVDDYRDRCLWFLRPDFYPRTLEQKLRVLKYTQRYGDHDAYRKAAEARRWLVQSSSETSAASESARSPPRLSSLAERESLTWNKRRSARGSSNRRPRRLLRR